MRGLLFGNDAQVAAWLYLSYNMRPFPFDRAVGIIESDGRLAGAALFQRYNGYDIELSYYGLHTATPGIIRGLFRYAIDNFGPSRLTVHTSKRNKRMIRALTNPGFGFRLEGTQRCYYGHNDTIRNTAVRLVLFRSGIERVAYGIKAKAAA